MTTGTRRRQDIDRNVDRDDWSDDDRWTRPRRWPWLLALALLIALIGGGAFVVWRTPLLAVENIVVTGVRDGLATQVRAAAADQQGVPLISVDTGEVTDAVAALPKVASVTVNRHWPNTLDIAVTPRVPVATTQANGHWWLLDSDGLPYLQVQQRPVDLIAIELATPGKGDAATLAALQVLRALDDDLLAQLVSITAPTPYRIALQLTRNRTVIWGEADQSQRKSRVLPAVLQQPGSTYDISDPSMVTVE